MNAQIRQKSASALRALAFRFRRETTGSAVVEFALLAPVLFMLLIGMFQFGIMINNYIQLTEAVRVGGRTLAISRGSTTPFTTARNAVYASAPGLKQANMGFTMTVNGTACAADGACKSTFDSAQGTQASITVTYSVCNAIIYGKNYLPNCNLSSTTSVRVE
jgi:Flp pilus assembly protein TadG